MQRIIYSKYGGPEVMKVETVASPSPKNGELLVQLSGTTINPVDVKVRSGALRFISGWKFPRVPGSDFSGTIKRAGAGYEVGDEVFGFLSPMKGGAYAEEIVIRPKNCAPKPASLDLAEAGVVPIVGLTALEGLINHAKLKPEHTIFINGCTGGVGSFAVQIAKAIGSPVTGTCSGKNIDFAREIGVDTVYDYTQNDPTELPEKFDVVFDTTGRFSPKQFEALGTPSAKFCTTGFSLPLLLKSIFSSSMKLIIVQPSDDRLRQLSTFIDAHRIEPVITSKWKLSEAREAHATFEELGGKGKALLTA